MTLQIPVKKECLWLISTSQVTSLKRIRYSNDCFCTLPRSSLRPLRKKKSVKKCSLVPFGTFSLILSCCSSLTPLWVTSLYVSYFAFLSAGDNRVLSSNKCPLSDFHTSILKKLEKVPLFYLFIFCPYCVDVCGLLFSSLLIIIYSNLKTLS